jgi:hypothetical protein
MAGLHRHSIEVDRLFAVCNGGTGAVAPYLEFTRPIRARQMSYIEQCIPY